MRGVKLPHGLKPEGLGGLSGRRLHSRRSLKQASAASLAQSPVQGRHKVARAWSSARSGTPGKRRKIYANPGGVA